MPSFWWLSPLINSMASPRLNAQASSCKRSGCRKLNKCCRCSTAVRAQDSPEPLRKTESGRQDMTGLRNHEILGPGLQGCKDQRMRFMRCKPVASVFISKICLSAVWKVITKYPSPTVDSMAKRHQKTGTSFANNSHLR